MLNVKNLKVATMQQLPCIKQHVLC